MPSVEKLRQVYASYSDGELVKLAARPEELTEEGQIALREEVSRRQLTSVPHQDWDAEPPRPTTPAWHSGWLTVFQAWITLLLIAFAAGYILGGSIDSQGVLMLMLLTGPGLIGLVLIAKRHHAARPYWLAILGVGLAVSLGAPLFGGGHTPAALIRAATEGAWFLYWLKSRRVAREFQKPLRADSVPAS